jgi:hypothetical protein
MSSQKQEPVEVASQMVEFDDPSLDQETDYDPELCDSRRNNHLLRAHGHLEPWRSLE